MQENKHVFILFSCHKLFSPPSIFHSHKWPWEFCWRSLFLFFVCFPELAFKFLVFIVFNCLHSQFLGGAFSLKEQLQFSILYSQLIVVFVSIVYSHLHLSLKIHFQEYSLLECRIENSNIFRWQFHSQFSEINCYSRFAILN